MDDFKWYVMYTTSRAEKKVAERLRERGWEVYLPLIEELRQWSDRKKKVERALFNGYVFVKTNRNKLWECLQVPGAVKFVHFSGHHATVREEEIELIQRVLATGVGVETDGSEIAPGEKVKVLGGPLQDLVGECIEKGNKDVYLCFGAEVCFSSEHVIEIARPPKEYIEWQLGLPPERLWPRK